METHHDTHPEGKPKKAPPKNADSQSREGSLKDQLPAIVIPPAELDDIPKGPLDLLSAVAALQIRRKKKVQAQRQAKTDAREARITRRLPATIAAQNAAAAASKAAHRKERREETYPEREKRRLERVKRSRERERTVEQLAREDIWGRIEDVVGEEMVGGRLVMREGEGEEEFMERMRVLRGMVDEMGWAEWCKRELGSVRYFEGVPLNVMYTPPSIVSMLWPICRGPSNRGRCLNCEVKGMPCSLTVREIDGKNPEGGCTRCARMGEKCVVKHPRFEDEPWNWYAVDGSHWGDNRDFINRLWKKKMGELGTKALPEWDETEVEEGTTETTIDEKRWWHILKDTTAENMCKPLQE